MASPNNGKVALITGASSGIGLAIAKALYAAGYNIVVTGRDEARLQQAYSDCEAPRILYIQADATDQTSYANVVGRTIVHFKRLDVLVNNVGGGVLGKTLAATTLNDFNSAIQFNLTSVFFTSQAAVPYLTETKGTIINFSSILASRPVAGLGPYSAAKAAVEMLTKTMAIELASHGVRVMCISPATIQTHFHESAGMSPQAAAAYYEASKQTHPVGRIGQPEDISELVVFLADSTKAGFMTGSVIHVDGGRLLTSATANLSKN
jgi:NAD(P)-dependent dehydrogenase (short-subunit alcohol dehydrogenase family)